ncbi:MAG: CopG family ribbon-helix-helix protein [Fimbriiglobus sp.]
MTLHSVTVRLPEQDIQFLDSLGKVHDRNRSYLIKEAVEQYIVSRKWQIEEIERAIVEADAGNFVPDEEMQRIMAKWTS